MKLRTFERAKHFRRVHAYSARKKWATRDEGAYLLYTGASGNSNSGHDYRTKLSESEKRDLIEYFKAL